VSPTQWKVDFGVGRAQTSHYLSVAGLEKVPLESKYLDNMGTKSILVEYLGPTMCQ